MEWLESGQIKITLPKKCKKLTGTRLGAILGLNPFQTPFQAWCEITKTYQEPFKDSIYTVAGKIIEPLQRKFIEDNDFVVGMKSPSDIFGADFFASTYGDFYHDEPVFGGMWDSLEYDLETNKPIRVFEYKTTKRSEDWLNDTPIYYKAQAFLYAYLLGVTDVSIVCTFLEDKDYPTERIDGTFDTSKTEKFVCTTDNTIRRDYNILEDKFLINGEEFTIEELVKGALEWWNTYVETGISPQFDEKKDKDILDVLRKNNVNPTDDINEIVAEYEALTKDINAIESAIKEKTDRQKVLETKIKDHLNKQFRDGDKKVVMSGKHIEFTLSKTTTSSIDKDALKKDGILARYEVIKETVKLTKKEIKEDK